MAANKDSTSTEEKPAATDISENADDRRAKQKRLEETGEPERDRLGNEDGAS